MMSGQYLVPDTRLRRLKLEHWRKLVEVLTINDRWQDVACKVTRSSDKNELMFSAADIDVLERQSKLGASPAEAFLDHWSTSSKNQPTISDLLKLLVDAELYQAADNISRELLGEPVVIENSMEFKTDEVLADLKRKLFVGESEVQTVHKFDSEDTNCTVKITNSDSNQEVSVSTEAGNALLATADGVTEVETKLTAVDKITCLSAPYKYSELANATENFCNISVYNGGCKVGEGAYGTVYRAYLRGKWVAIKKLNDPVDKQFFTELEVLTKYKHENLLPLLGYSSDGPFCCLVYAYMKNGCLQDRLACEGLTQPIDWRQRIAIAYYTACGINHLHTYGTKPVVHRDIKSANVLLDEKMVPKVGDFGLARVGSRGGSSTIAVTSRVCGTHIYMPREAFSGEVTIKVDSFSYGVVLIELLTGLSPYDPSRRETDLVSYMEENCYEVEDIEQFLDTKAGQWDLNIAKSLYAISKHCMETRSKDRPRISEVLPSLKKLLDTAVEKQSVPV